MKFSLLILLITLSSCGSTNNKSKENTVNTSTENIADEQLLNQVQKEAIKYFWDYAEPNSKLARERYHTDDPSFEANKVTTGGSGFGLMSLIVGIERGFIPRDEAVSRMTIAMDFLEKADRFHGAWSHWIDGITGKAISFGTKDDGGDIVETAFLCQGLIAVREYFKNGNTQEKTLSRKADNLWKAVEWNWYTNGENAMYWHWSPNYGWEMKFKLEGYNECLIAYILGASSTTHPITAVAYHQGWARNGAITTEKTQYSIPLVLKYNTLNGKAGPLF
ncbi:MAG: beta-glucosidase, partial [Flavobacteriaceae bacterium]|nr:beta-glucosidase [Flavobacteriaceae bacterium]